jgi:hypothetical protein
MYGKLSIYVNLMNYYQDKLFTQKSHLLWKIFMSYKFILLANTLQTFCTSLCLRDFEVSQLKFTIQKLVFTRREF